MRFEVIVLLLAGIFSSLTAAKRDSSKITYDLTREGQTLRIELDFKRKSAKLDEIQI